ncbi:MAG: tetratricopeptide repeat protein [Spirochaetia bacterium]|nr:tetratricopeptide repeat protein [Spirochaetia bacterium]
MKYFKTSFFVKKMISLFSALFFTVSVSVFCEDAFSLFQKGMAFQEDEDYYGAIEAYTDALALNGKYGDAWYNLAYCTYCLDESDLAFEYIQKAEVYAKNKTEIQNLKGMILISLGKYDDARSVFENILKTYPNNVDARFGLAELSLFEGSFTNAQEKYLEALKRDNTNRKALLSLALVCSETQEYEKALHYINLALEYHSGEAFVHYLAAYLAAKRGDFEEGERRAKSAMQIKGSFDQAYELLANILYAQKRYEEVIDICDFRIGRNRNLTDAWYLKGISLAKLGRISEAINILNTALAINPYDEIMRLYLEQLVNENLSIEDPRRKNWAQFHVEKAAEYKRNFDGPSERYEYQKALTLNPLDNDCRQKFADMLERESLYELYLNQLKFIRQNQSEQAAVTNTVQKNENSPSVKKTDRQIKNEDAIEALESQLQSSLSRRWKIDPFYLDKTRWKIGIFYIKSPVQLLHADCEEIIAFAERDIFSGVASAAVEVQSKSVGGFGEAFRLSRSAGLDYFAIIKVDETQRSFSLDAVIYSGRTGTETARLQCYRTGNDRVARTLRRFRQAVLDILPVRGKVLQVTNGSILVDLGKSDGILKGSQFDVVRKGKVVTKDNGPGVYYSENDIVGTFTCSVVDEEICEGEFLKKGFYDILNPGDEVVLTMLPDGNAYTVGGNAATDIKPAADKDGKPASENSENSDEEFQKESIRNHQRESSLISMIKMIF